MHRPQYRAVTTLESFNNYNNNYNKISSQHAEKNTVKICGAYNTALPLPPALCSVAER